MAECYPWQSATWSRLADRKQHSHAYLLHGPAGIGKRALADRLVALLLCQNVRHREACGQCKACLLLKAGTHPDFFLVEPEELEKPIRVDQIRDLVGFVTQTPQLGGRKLVLMEPAEAMNLNASNALLKSLEEPSGDTVLLLLSHQPSRLLPTIKSRCVQQACPMPTESVSLAWLAEMLPELSESTRKDLLVLSGGSPLKAVRLQNAGVLACREQVVDGLKKLLKRQLSPSALAESWNSMPLGLLLDWFCEWALLILRYQMTRDITYSGLADMAKVIQYLGDKAATDQVLAWQAWVLEQRQHVMNKANLNRVLLLESLLVRWASLPSQS
ncbi:DNA polymerase-3 subunit delta' [Pseudomonas duriflava]|uniref:DNA polymerase III subunit delta' n=1 Tax=Pseudomonas duriflava TaxID=459528 RepID=A0A562Q9N5_9PSED|nr:DNA polymerase III subunit delta' [Pseudomonas duriflava]TWI53429.1 DNA polymerase-3 subunit delta' [Pseudomonas duriflava]